VRGIRWSARISDNSWFVFGMPDNYCFFFTKPPSKAHWEDLDNLSFLVPQFLVPSTLEHEIQNYISAFAHKTDEELMRETHRWVAHSEQHIAAKILIEQRRKAKEKAQEELEQLRHSEIQRQLEELKRPHWTVLPNFWLTFASAIAAVIAAYLGWLALKATTSAPPSPTPPTATSPIKPVAKQPATPTKP